MRGFNLFAAFLGVVMLAVAVGFSIYTFSEESATITEISAQIAHHSAESIADLIRQDAHNTVVESVRRGFQNFFSSNDLDPPDDVWDSEDAFKAWFSNEFVRSSRLTQFLADYIAEELLLYQNLPLKGHTVRVVVNRKDLGEALAKGTSVEFREDGTFVFVYDTSLLEPEDMAKLPTIVVDGTETVSVFPPGKWMIPIPLRIVEAYRKAKAFRERVKSNIGDFKILFGSCDLESSPACGIYEWRGKPVLRYPSEGLPQNIRVVASEVGTGTWTAYNLTSGACGDLALAVNDELRDLPIPVDLPDHIVCNTYAETVLYGLLQKKLSQLVEGDWEAAVVRPETMQKFRTWRIFTQQAISISNLAGESFPPLKWILDMVLNAIPGAQIVPLSPCRPSGYMYCAVPIQLAYVYTWVDSDTNYSVTGTHAVFSFRQVFLDPFDDIYTRYKARDERVKRITPGGVETVDVNFSPEECEERARQWCAEQVVKNYEECARLEIEQHGLLGEFLAGAISVGQALMDICSNDALKYVCGVYGLYSTIKEVGEQAYLSEWENIQKMGHTLYIQYAEEYNKCVEECNRVHAEEYNKCMEKCGIAGQCMYMFYAFKDENALCMDTNKNFCEYFSWLENGVPEICPDKEYVAYSVFWFHPFDEFVATCTANKMPDSPG